MKIIDLSKELYPDMDVYPGDPHFGCERISTINDKGCNVSRITACVHNGTHADSPFHFIDGADTVEKLPLEYFVGQAYVIHVSPDENNLISTQRVADSLKGRGEEKILLLETGNPTYPTYKDIPRFSVSLAGLLSSLRITSLGLDSPSLEPSAEMHRALLASGIVLIEALTNLQMLDGSVFFSAAPLKIAGCDGAPVRAYAVTDK